MTYGYLRVSTIDQDNEKFRHDILEYANGKELGSVEFVSEKVSGVKTWRKRELGALLERCEASDKIVVPELSRLARSISQVHEIINFCIEKHIGLHIIKQNIVINGKMDITTKVLVSTFAMVAELERDFISIRTREALQAKKAAGVQLGRPKGPGKSKLDEYAAEIREGLRLGIPKTKLAARYGTTTANLHHWLKMRKTPGAAPEGI